ncbi:unnamed protein product [Camellia sinensis]
MCVYYVGRSYEETYRNQTHYHTARATKGALERTALFPALLKHTPVCYTLCSDQLV